VRRKTSGVGFRLASQPRQDGKARTKQDEWELALLDPVHGHNEGAQLLVVEVLHFVDQQGHGRPAFLGGLSHGKKEIGEINLQVPAVRRAPLRFDVEADFDVSHGDFDAVEEAFQHRESAFDFVAGPCEAVQVVKHLAQMRREERPERFVLMSLDQDRPVVRTLGHTLDFIEQHGLAHAAQAGQEEAFLGLFHLHATK
jgi:hypothetical protein